MKPALTPEEWEARKVELPDCSIRAREGDGISVSNMPGHASAVFPDGLQALAALALEGQPFGFTWADVDHLRQVAEAVAAMPTSVTEPEDAEPLHSIADCIAALLPPREGDGE